MHTPAELHAQSVLLMVAIILAVGSVLGFVAQKLRMPDIVLFLLAGIVLGPQVTNVLSLHATSTLAWGIVIFGASYILFDGGASLKLDVLRQTWITLIIIATIGVLITAFITGLAAQWLLGLPFIVALLLGAAVAATDPATLMPVFKQVHVRDKVAQTVVSESALNDPMGAIITFAVLGVALHHGAHLAIGKDVIGLLVQAGIGVLAGIILGYIALFVIAHEKFGFLREYLPMVTLIVVIGGYLGAAGLHASGFMAAFVAGIVVGNKEKLNLGILPHEQTRLADFVDTTSLMARMFIFMLLGAQVQFDLIRQYWLVGLGVVAVFMFIARPVTVFLCAAPDRRSKWTLKELLFICWVRETGVIPGALASMLVGIRAPHADVIASVIFMAILITIILQATTTKWLAARLGLLESGESPMADVEEA